MCRLVGMGGIVSYLKITLAVSLHTDCLRKERMLHICETVMFYVV